MDKIFHWIDGILLFYLYTRYSLSVLIHLVVDCFAANITAYIREAEGFAPIAVVLHDQMEGVGKAGSLVYTKTTTNKKGKEKTEVFSKAEVSDHELMC